MNKQEIDQIIKELEQKGYTVQYNPPPRQHYRGGGNGMIFLFAIGIMVFGAWVIMNQQKHPIQGFEPTNSHVVITESPAIILATGTPIAYPTNTPFPTVEVINPVLPVQEWPRPITLDQYNQCLANHNVNPACGDYLRANGVIP